MAEGEVIEEIIVRQKNGGSGGVIASGIHFIRPFFARSGAVSAPTAPGPAPAGISKPPKKKPPPKPKLPPGMTRAEFNLGRARAASLEAVFDRTQRAAIEEITVKAKRIGRRTSAFVRFSPFAGALVGAADLLAQISDTVSQQRLDEAGRVATRPSKPKPDTPVATIPDEVIPEIKVFGRRRPARPRTPLPVPTSRPGTNVLTPDFSVGFPSQLPGIVTAPVAKPKPPKQTAKPKPRNLPTTTLRPTVGSDPRFFGDPRVRSTPRQTPKIPTARPAPRPPIFAGPSVTGVPLSDPTRTGSSFCPPCKPKKPKPRTKCYKKLVKERTNPKNDVETKWTEINCRTGREITKPRKR